MFLLKDLVILDPNPSNSKRTAPMKMERLVGGLTQVFLKRRDWTASVGCKADTGWDKWPCSLSLCGGRRSSMKLSSFHIMSISTSCSSHVSFERSSHAWTNSELICKQANEVRAMWDAQHKTVLWKQVWVLECVLREIIGFVLENYAYLRLGSFESGCMHNLLKSIPAPRCLKSWTC